MKIVIADDCGGMGAHTWQRKAMAKALVYCGHDVTLWDIDKRNAYDCFDLHNPDLLISQTYNLNEALINCIAENPAIKVIMKASDWGSNTEEVSSKYPILIAKQHEIDLVRKLKEKTGKPDYLFIHYHPDKIYETHNFWVDNGFDIRSDLNAADIFEYTNGMFKSEYECDIGYVGGSWDYKNLVLHPYILPLCEDFSYKIKIFGKGWTMPQSCGFLKDGEEKDFYASAKINLCLHEPHSHEYGFDITEKAFKLASNKSFFICDYVEGLKNLFPEAEPLMAKTPKEFKEKIDHFLQNPKEKDKYVHLMYKKILANHTYFTRCYDMFSWLDLEEEAKNVIKCHGELYNRMKL